ncbi:MAG: FKBP-type peptidyl-prolyl cis-trans isomerase [Prevotella sp.]|jgi:FKBP-type peptidyl-prolyl cis-trans isomerase FklB|nr:FKBP-type peptidyl-prolyl cis-trans isomerase [Prevotella sp.]
MKLKHYIFACLSLLVLASCSEDDGKEEEYPDWQNKNEQAFLQIYNQADPMSGTLFPVMGVLRAENANVEDPTNYIVMELLESGYGTVSPLYSDTVTIHYSGKLLPSTRYKDGLRFDASYYGDVYDEGVSPPYKGRVSNFIEGFNTALQHMNRGDIYRVYIPYQLGYGSTATSSIPAYSMLTFTIQLVDFWHAKEGDRPEE